jgi:hypothetical protein
MFRFAAAMAAFFALSQLCLAQAPVLPNPDFLPEDVISIQLKALSEAENDPATNSGIARVWAFAHPSNRRMTGPLSRFAKMLQSPNYRALIGHRAHKMRLLSQTDKKARYAIKITAGDGAILGYVWELGKVDAGEFAGMWMTTSVALVGKIGQSL